VALFTLRGLGVRPFRANLLAYLLTLGVVGLPTLLAQGAVGRDDLTTGAALVPAALLGRLLGMAMARRVTATAFRRVTLVLLLLTGALGVANALWSLAS